MVDDYKSYYMYPSYEILVFDERGKPEYLEENLSEQSREASN